MELAPRITLVFVTMVMWARNANIHSALIKTAPTLVFALVTETACFLTFVVVPLDLLELIANIQCVFL